MLCAARQLTGTSSKIKERWELFQQQRIDLGNTLLKDVFLGLRETGQIHGGETHRGVLKKEEAMFSSKGL